MQGACLQVGQLDLANASLVAAAGGNPISPSMLAAQGKLALGPHEVPPSMAQPRLLIEQQMQRGSVPTTSGGQSNEEMTATEEERLRHASVAPAHAAAAHSFGSSGKTLPMLAHCAWAALAVLADVAVVQGLAPWVGRISQFQHWQASLCIVPDIYRGQQSMASGCAAHPGQGLGVNLVDDALLVQCQWN